MKKLLLIFLSCICFLSGCSTSEDKKQYKITNDEEFVNTIEYFADDMSENAIEAISDYLITNEASLLPIAIEPLKGFYIGILKNNKQMFFSQRDKMENLPSIKNIFIQSNTLSKDIELILSGEQTYYPNDEKFIDILWGYYYATADYRVVNIVCKIKDRDMNSELRAKAKHTLKSHMDKFPSRNLNCPP